jgi:hypothetical protein
VPFSRLNITQAFRFAVEPGEVSGLWVKVGVRSYRELVGGFAAGHVHLVDTIKTLVVPA